MNSSERRPISYSKIALVLISVAVLVFLTGLVKEPAPSDTIRSWIVGVLGVLGLLFYFAGRLVARRS